MFKRIWADVKWLGKEIGKGFTELPHLLKLGEDVEQAAPSLITDVTAVVDKAGDLTAATIKDGGVFVTAFTELAGAVSLAVAQKGVNVAEDTAVVAAFENFCAQFNASNVKDILDAWAGLNVTTQALDGTIKLLLAQLAQDAEKQPVQVEDTQAAPTPAVTPAVWSPLAN